MMIKGDLKFMCKMISNCVKCGNSNPYLKYNMVMMDKLYATLIYSALNVAKA